MAAGALKLLGNEAAGFNHGIACSNGDAGLTAADFATADIVLTTYETLKRDLHRHGVEDRTRELRRPKKYQVGAACLSSRQAPASPAPLPQPHDRTVVGVAAGWTSCAAVLAEWKHRRPSMSRPVLCCMFWHIRCPACSTGLPAQQSPSG